MIGKRVIGLSHLVHIAQKQEVVQILFTYEHRFVLRASVVYVPEEQAKKVSPKSGHESLIFFNNAMGGNDSRQFLGELSNNSDLSNTIKDLRSKFSTAWVVDLTNQRRIEEAEYAFMKKIVLPDDFEEGFLNFCELNKKVVSECRGVLHEPSSDFLEYFYCITNGSKNFFTWAVNAYAKRSMQLDIIERILSWNDKYNQLSKNLKKSSITSYNSEKDLFALMSELSALRREKRANDVIKMFNTNQRNVLKQMNKNIRTYEIISKFAKLSFKKKSNFIKKMSSVNDAQEIIKQMAFLIDVHFEWNKESLKDFIKNSDNFDCDIVLDRDNILLLKVNNYDTVKRLAKSTNWCIAKDKKYWDQYVEQRPMATQYVFMDFSKREDDNYSIVGFTTVHDIGIINAHDFQNNNLISGRKKRSASKLKSYVNVYSNVNDIYGVLERNGINLDDIITFEPSAFEWNRESALDAINDCISDDDYYIIHDQDNKMVVITESPSIKYFLGRQYTEYSNANYGRRGGESEHIIFMDFSKKGNDHNRLCFGIIKEHPTKTYESIVDGIYNAMFEKCDQSFDSKLAEFGLPYDVICRTYDPVNAFYQALSDFDFATAKSLIGDEKIQATFKDHYNVMASCINTSIYESMSFDFIDFIYSNGLTLSRITNPSTVGETIENIIRMLITDGENVSKKNPPSEEDIDKLKNGKIANINKSKYVNNFIILMKIISGEKDILVFEHVVNWMNQSGVSNELYVMIYSAILDKLSEINSSKKLNSLIKCISNTAYITHSTSLMAKIIECGFNCPYADKFKEEISKSKNTLTWQKNSNGNYVYGHSVVEVPVFAV